MARAGCTMVFVVAASLTSGAAFAQADAGVATPSSAPDADALVVELDKQISALSTADCVVACQALGSMRRTVERICALDPGTRCDKARAKVEAVARLIALSCPACPEAPGVVVAKPVSPTALPPAPGVAEVASRKGGCAACSVGADDASGLGALAAMLACAAFALRRRRR